MTAVRHSAGDLSALSASKFLCPRVPRRAVYRTRLVERLNDPDWKVALVTGGPATGKTVATAQWFDQIDGTARAWLTMGKEDDNHTAFLRSLLLGVSDAAPGAFIRTGELIAESRVSAARMFDQLLSELWKFEDELVVVLEDVHLLHVSQIWQDITTLLDKLPPSVRVVMTSRVDPPIPTALWTAHSWFAQIRQADLAFTLPETSDFFDALDEHRLTSDDVEVLWQHTGGWAAGLHLAASQIRHQANAGAAAREFSGHQRMVADLMTTEILEMQSQEISEFMLQTSVLDVLDPGACDALTGRTDSVAILRSLETSMPFIEAVDPRAEVYRFHPLLNDVLRSLLETKGRGTTLRLSRIAATVVEQRGDIESAMRYLNTAGDRSGVAALALEVASNRYVRLPHEALNVLNWADLVRPDSDSEPIDSILAYMVSLCLANRVDEGISWLERAALRIPTDSPYGRNAAFVDAFRLSSFTVMTGYGDGIGAGRRVLAALEHGTLEDGVEHEFPCTRVRPDVARCHLLFDQPRDGERVLAGGSMGDEMSQLILGPAVAARVAVRLGDLTKGEDLTNHALAAARSLEMDQELGTLDAYLAQAEVHLDRNQLEDARSSIKILKVICETHPETVVYQILTRLVEVRFAAARNCLDDVFGLIEEMQALMGVRRRPALERLVNEVAARCAINAMDLSDAEEFISRLPGDCPQHGLLSSRLLLAQDRPHDALASVSDRDYDNRRDRLSFELLRASAAVAAKDQRAETYAAAAAELAAPEGFVRPILEEGPVVTRLVRLALEKRNTHAGLQLAASLGAPPRIRQAQRPSLVLSDREQAVLRFLPTLLTNREIANECNMSVNTVKTHIKNLYAKLDTTSRSGAVDRARTMGVF